MTSRNLRKSKKWVQSEFPCNQFIQRISRIKDITALGYFNYDKICLSFNKPWRVEDLPGLSKGSERQFDKTGKKLTGYLHHRNYKGFNYQIFQGRGKVRNIQINPRHFPSFTAFDSYCKDLTNGRQYNITRVDFSWLLKKEIFSVAIVDWSMWVKGLTVLQRRIYQNEIHDLVDKGSFHEISYGSKAYKVKCYDCDAFNIQSKRPEHLKNHGVINLEISCGTKFLKESFVTQVPDLNFVVFKHILSKIDFFRPSDMCFHNSELTYLYDEWEKRGLTLMARNFYSVSREKSYTSLKRRLRPLSVKGTPFKKLLIDLAEYDLNLFVNGKLRTGRYSTKRLAYLMPPPLF